MARTLASLGSLVDCQKELISLLDDHALGVGIPPVPPAFVEQSLAIEKKLVALLDDHALGVGIPTTPLALAD